MKPKEVSETDVTFEYESSLINYMKGAILTYFKYDLTKALSACSTQVNALETCAKTIEESGDKKFANVLYERCGLIRLVHEDLENIYKVNKEKMSE